MTVPLGNVAYNLDIVPCSGIGVTWTHDELDSALEGPVAAFLFDDAGAADVASILAPLANTEFEQDGLRRILSIPEDIEDWRVGEAIAESYLSDHRACYFPWPDGRDERKSGSSLPGADLVGFCTDVNGDRFAFGEVKTSREEKYPPSLVYGRTGLKQQLEDLCDRQSIRDRLMHYLGYRAKSSPWRARFETASRRYLVNSSDVQVYGVLVRDVTPDKDDLRARVEALGKDCPQGTIVELLAIYLPTSSIRGIGGVSIAKRKGDAP